MQTKLRGNCEREFGCRARADSCKTKNPVSPPPEVTLTIGVLRDEPSRRRLFREREMDSYQRTSARIPVGLAEDWKVLGDEDRVEATWLDYALGYSRSVCSSSVACQVRSVCFVAPRGGLSQRSMSDSRLRCGWQRERNARVQGRVQRTVAPRTRCAALSADSDHCDHGCFSSHSFWKRGSERNGSQNGSSLKSACVTTIGGIKKGIL